MALLSSKKKVLGLFQIVMINVIAVDSIRTLPFSAEYGFSLIFFYLLGALIFMIPSALVSAELGTGWPKTGGIYVWIREAFGEKVAFISIWFNWIYNVVWFPTIMALLAGTFAYFFNPALANNKTYMIFSILILFWLVTLLNCLGMKVSSFISSLGATIGTIIPMLFIIILGIVWLIQSEPLQTEFNVHSFFPNITNLNNLAFFSSIIFGLLGLEMVATHAQEMKNPQKDYPKALFISILIILSTMIFSSLAISIAVPHKKLSLITGMLQAFDIFFQTFNLSWVLPYIIASIIIGGLSGVAAWIIGPAKSLMIASQDGSLPKIFTKKNRHNVPVNILILQGMIVSFLCLIFILMPSVNSSFWLLSIMTAQLALIVYVVLFAAAIKLRHSKPHISRSFIIPGGNIGIWLIGSIGIIVCFVSILFGFLPPTQIDITNIWVYEIILIGGIFIFFVMPFIIYKFKKCK